MPSWLSAPKRVVVPAAVSLVCFSGWLVMYGFATSVLHSWLSAQELRLKIGTALSQTSHSLVRMIAFASEEMRLNIGLASCAQHSSPAQLQERGFDAMRAAQASTDKAISAFESILKDGDIFQYLEFEQIEGSLAGIEAIMDLRAKCQDSQAWRDSSQACTVELTDAEIEAAEESLTISSGCERAWSSSVLEPMWHGLVEVGASTREPAGFPPSTYIAPMALYSSVVNVITTLSKWQYTNDFTQAGAAATHVLTISLRSNLELFEAALRSVLAISSIEPELMQAAERSTADQMGFMWLMNMTQLASIASTDRAVAQSRSMSIPSDWYFRLSDLLKAMIEMQRSAHFDYKSTALDSLQADITEIAGLLQIVHMCTTTCCTLIVVTTFYMYEVYRARWTNGHRLLVQTLSLLKTPLRLMQLFLANLKNNLPPSVRDDAKFRQTAHSIAAALDNLSSAVSTGLSNSNSILSSSIGAVSKTQAIDLKCEIPALLARYQMLRDVRMEVQLFRSIPSQVELDAEALITVISGCISHMLQSVMPQSSINIAVSAVVNDSHPHMSGKCALPFQQQCITRAFSGSKLIFSLSLGKASQRGKPYRLLDSNMRQSVELRQAHPSLNYLSGLVQRNLGGQMGAVVDVAHSSAPVIGVWFFAVTDRALPAAEPGFDIAVVNSAVHSGAAEQGLSVVMEEAVIEVPSDISAPMDEIVLLCHSAQQRDAWKVHCTGQFSIVEVPCNTPASFPIQWREYRHLLADVKAILLSVDDIDLEHAKQAVAAARASGWLPSIVGVVQHGRIAKGHKLPGMTGVIQLKNLGHQLEWFIDSIRRVSSRTIRTSAGTSSSNADQGFTAESSPRELSPQLSATED